MCQWYHPHNGTARWPMSRCGMAAAGATKRTGARKRRRRRRRPAQRAVGRVAQRRLYRIFCLHRAVGDTITAAHSRSSLASLSPARTSIRTGTPAVTVPVASSARENTLVRRVRVCPRVAHARVPLSARPVQSVDHRPVVRALVYRTTNAPDRPVSQPASSSSSSSQPRRTPMTR